MSEVKIIKFPDHINGSVLIFSCYEKDVIVLAAIIFVIAIIVCFISPLSAISPIAVFLTAIGISGGITYFYYRVKKSKDIRPSHYKHYVLRRGFPILTAIEKKKFAKKGIHPSYFPYGSDTIFRD